MDAEPVALQDGVNVLRITFLALLSVHVMVNAGNKLISFDFLVSVLYSHSAFVLEISFSCCVLTVFHKSLVITRGICKYCIACLSLKVNLNCILMLFYLYRLQITFC